MQMGKLINRALDHFLKEAFIFDRQIHRYLEREREREREREGLFFIE